MLETLSFEIEEGNQQPSANFVYKIERSERSRGVILRQAQDTQSCKSLKVNKIGEGSETISQESRPKYSVEAPHIRSTQVKDDDIVHAKGNFGTNVSDWS